MRKNNHGARHLHRAAELMAAAETNLRRALPRIKRLHVAGDLRRGSELVRNLTLVAETDMQQGVEHIKSGELTVTTTDKAHFGSALLHATGSDAHLEQLRHRAENKGLTLGEQGLLRRGKIVAAKTEAEIYKRLGLQFIESELRSVRKVDPVSVFFSSNPEAAFDLSVTNC